MRLYHIKYTHILLHLLFALQPQRNKKICCHGHIFNSNKLKISYMLKYFPFFSPIVRLALWVKGSVTTLDLTQSQQGPLTNGTQK